MSYRDVLQKRFYSIVNPLVKGMVKVGITPNFITTMGFVFNVVAAGLIICGGVTNPDNLNYMGWSGGLIHLAGMIDVTDGHLARTGNMSSAFGAFYDSILDRYSDLLTMISISFWMFINGYEMGGIITLIALVGSIMVSYVRARAEGLGIKCKVGFMQRMERVVLTGFGLIFCSVFARCQRFDSVIILILAMSFIALLANLTAIRRIMFCRRELKGKPLA